jgi:hypothetical protein
MNKRINQYILNYEELNSDNINNENSNDDLNDEMKALMIKFSSSLSKTSDTEAFMIFFESMKISKILIVDLTNRSFSHFLIKQFIVSQIDLKNDEVNILQIDMKIIDSFTYVIASGRYISEKFYEIMIDSDVSKFSIADYEQYLAFIRNNKNETINTIKTEAIHVQFEIDFIFLIESLTIDISIEMMKFHIVKIDTSFLLSLADMNRLKVYFNNIENVLMKKIIKTETFSVIRRFGHDFLL